MDHSGRLYLSLTCEGLASQSLGWLVAFFFPFLPPIFLTFHPLDLLAAALLQPPSVSQLPSCHLVLIMLPSDLLTSLLLSLLPVLFLTSFGAVRDSHALCAPLVSGLGARSQAAKFLFLHLFQALLIHYQGTALQLLPDA